MNFDFLQLAEERYSVRKFEDRPIEGEKMKQILRAGCVAPTACNLQPQRILVIEGEQAEKLKNCTKCHFNAPAALLVCYEKGACWTRRYDGAQSGEVDASIVTTHLMLEAASLGIGTTWVMHFDPEAVKREFAVPESYQPVAILVMGYPAPDAAPYPGHSEYKPEEDLIFYGAFEK